MRPCSDLGQIDLKTVPNSYTSGREGFSSSTFSYPMSEADRGLPEGPLAEHLQLQSFYLVRYELRAKH